MQFFHIHAQSRGFAWSRHSQSQYLVRQLESAGPCRSSPPTCSFLARLPFLFSPLNCQSEPLVKWRQRQIWKEWRPLWKGAFSLWLFPSLTLPQACMALYLQSFAGSLGTSRALSRRHRLSPNALKRLHVKRTKQEHFSSQPHWRDVNANVVKCKGSTFKTHFASV